MRRKNLGLAATDAAQDAPRPEVVSPAVESGAPLHLKLSLAGWATAVLLDTVAIVVSPVAPLGVARRPA